MVTIRYDEENPVFLATHCDRLRGPFIFPHSLSVNGSSGIAPGETVQVVRIRPYLYGFCVVCTEIRELCSIIRKSARVDIEVSCDID